MRSKKSYELLVIGAGSGGMSCAKRAAKYVENIAVIEERKPGGTCVNLGCMPKKVLWHLAQFKKENRLLLASGILMKDAEMVPWREIKKKKQEFIQHLNEMHLKSMKKEGLEYIEGHAKFMDSHILDVEGSTLEAQNIVIATGGVPVKLKIPGAEHCITSDGFFDLDEIPKTAVVIGDGYIGVETACLMANFGVDVHLLSINDMILPGRDEEVVKKFEKQLETHRGIKIHHKLEAAEVTKTGNKSLKLVTKQGKSFEVDCVMMATGRKTNLSHMDLDKIGINLSKKQTIEVDDKFRSSVDNIYAIGDCIDKVPLTPVAIRQGRVLAEILYGKDKGLRVDYNDIPTVIFSDPPLGTCGYTEKQAKDKFGQDDIQVYKSTMKPTNYALINSDLKEESLFKLIAVKSQNNRIVGAHLLGQSADELIQTMSVLIKKGITKKELDAAMAVHPTSSEELVLMQPYYL